jgi:hypothetical protein
MIEPGEGYELVRSGDHIHRGDEVWENGKWVPTRIPGTIKQWGEYRRRVEKQCDTLPIEPVNGGSKPHRLTATEARLLTQGSADLHEEALDRILADIEKAARGGSRRMLVSIPSINLLGVCNLERDLKQLGYELSTPWRTDPDSGKTYTPDLHDSDRWWIQWA